MVRGVVRITRVLVVFGDPTKLRSTTSELRYRGADKIRRANAIFNDSYLPVCKTGKDRKRVRFETMSCLPFFLKKIE